MCAKDGETRLSVCAHEETRCSVFTDKKRGGYVRPTPEETHLSVRGRGYARVVCPALKTNSVRVSAVREDVFQCVRHTIASSSRTSLCPEKESNPTVSFAEQVPP